MKELKFQRKPFNTRVACICRVRTAKIMYRGVEIGRISEERNDAGEFDWVIAIDWAKWEEMGRPPIAGINVDLRLKEYVRNNVIPSFVEQRTLPDNRDRLQEELQAVGLRCNDRFEFMCRTRGLCGPSNLTVERAE